MPKPFAALDVDGTIFKSSLAEKVVDSCIEARIFTPEPFNEVFANKRRWQKSNNEGLYQAYLHRLVGAFVNQIAGVEVEQFDRVIDSMLEQHAIRKFGFPRQLLRSLRSSHYLIAISGSPDILVEPFLKDLAIQASYGSRFEVEDGKFTGQATSVGNKATLLSGLVDSGVVTQEGSLAMGDTVSDIPMLEYATTQIMFNATRTLTDYGREFGWLRVNEVKDQVTILNKDNETGVYSEQDLETTINLLST